MHHHVFQKAAAAFAIVFFAGFGPLASAQITNPPALVPPGSTGMQVFIPARIDHVPEDNDYNNPDSEYCYKHSKSTANFVLFWAKEYGDDPMTNAITNRRFDIDAVLKEADRFYNFYVNDMKFVDKDHSYATQYKFLFFVIPSPNQGTGTATGGSIDTKIGAFWTPATRINRGPYGVVAHELGHSFQALTQADTRPWLDRRRGDSRDDFPMDALAGL